MQHPKQKAAWQLTECPTWCVVEHHDGDHIHDRRHQSTFVELPVLAVAEAHNADAAFRDSWDATDLAICLQLREGAKHTEVYIGDGVQQRLAIDLPSALRLADNLRAIVHALATSTGVPSDTSAHAGREA